MFIINSYDIYIFIKLILSIYIAWTSIQGDKLNSLVVPLILIYIIIVFIRGIVGKHSFLVNMLYILEGFVAYILTTKCISTAVLLLSILIAEYFIKEKKHIYSGIFLSSVPIIFVIFITNDNSLKDITVILVIILILMVNNDIQSKNINNLDETQEEQRKVIYKLQRKLVDERDIHEQTLYTARLEERNKISARLHDKIGHTISGTLLQLEATKFIIDNDKEKGISMIDNCIDNLSNGMEEIRMTLRNIKPAEEELGINRIRKILDEKIKGTNINGKVVYNGDLDKINANLWIAFIQIITELTTNSIKYSNCNLILINIEILNKFIKLEVKDDGLGCKDINKGIGLRNIEETVGDISGKLIINCENGFDVIILIPY